MACACKVNKEIDRISKYYAYNRASNKEKPKMSVNKKDAAIMALIYLMLLPLVPLMFLTVIIFSIFSKDGRISLNKFLNFIHRVRNGREQQVI